MPLVNVKLPEGSLSPAQKSKLAQNLTDAVVAVEGEKMRGFVWVVIDEVKSGDWNIGGKALTPELLRTMAAG